MSNADQTMRTGFIAILLGVGLLAIIPASLAQSDIADVLTTQASSEIGNPLRAQINVGSLPSLRGDISVSLASQGAFDAFDIGRYQILSSLRFSLRMNSAENYLLDIDSASPLNEPSLRFVVAFTGGGETSLMPIEVFDPGFRRCRDSASDFAQQAQRNTLAHCESNKRRRNYQCPADARCPAA